MPTTNKTPIIFTQRSIGFWIDITFKMDHNNDNFKPMIIIAIVHLNM